MDQIVVIIPYARSLYSATIKLSKYWTEQDPVSSIEAMEEYQGIQENIYDEIETVREQKSQSLVYRTEV